MSRIHQTSTKQASKEQTPLLLKCCLKKTVAFLLSVFGNFRDVTAFACAQGLGRVEAFNYGFESSSDLQGFEIEPLLIQNLATAITVPGKSKSNRDGCSDVRLPAQSICQLSCSSSFDHKPDRVGSSLWRMRHIRRKKKDTSLSQVDVFKLPIDYHLK